MNLAVWSGPRAQSTALARSFDARSDVVRVHDEPLYAHYLAETGLDHPVRDAVIASQSTDWRHVVAGLVAPADGLVYQKHMTHHLLPHMALDWVDQLVNVYLVRHPRKVLSSYVRVRGSVTLADIGIAQQVALFERAPGPVIDADDLRADPEGQLRRLCEAVGIDFEPAMLSWRPGPRDWDGAWAPHWYASVEASTGWMPPTSTSTGSLGALEPLAVEAERLYAKLRTRSA